MNKIFGRARGLNFTNHPTEIIERDEMVKEKMEKIKVLEKAKRSSVEINRFGAGTRFTIGS